MTISETLLPAPNVVFAAIVELVAADQPRSTGEGLDLLKSVGICSGTFRPTPTQSAMVAIEPIGSWRATRSSMALRPDATVSGFVSSMWYNSAPEDVALGFRNLVGAVNGAIGAPSREERRSDGSNATWWTRPHFGIEFHFFAETPRSRAGAQISVHWECADSATAPQ